MLVEQIIKQAVHLHCFRVINVTRNGMKAIVETRHLLQILVTLRRERHALQIQKLFHNKQEQSHSIWKSKSNLGDR